MYLLVKRGVGIPFHRHQFLPPECGVSTELVRVTLAQNGNSERREKQKTVWTYYTEVKVETNVLQSLSYSDNH